MNVLIISQCSKSALIETRRILDQFAERKGDRAWQTAITQQGLDTLRKMLRKKAKRNTSVACHWIKSGNKTELLWIIGNAGRFNEYGTVPTNTTERDVLRSQDENLWHSVEDISLLAGIAGLFHDFGKANQLFQDKLNPKKKKNKSYEPYRHEWVSLRLFEAFVKGQSDLEWVERLANVSEADEQSIIDIIEVLVKDKASEKSHNPFSNLTPLAKAVGWLVVSHHRLPKFLKTEKYGNEPRLENMDSWMTGERFNGSWNSRQSVEENWKDEDWQKLWFFPHGTPLRSQTWRAKAHELAQRALKRPELFQQDWLVKDRFTSHLARMTMMLADHCYSAGPSRECWQDQAYKAYANTDRKTGQLKQKLDEHNIGVGRDAVRLAKTLPHIRSTLPAITRHKEFKKRSVSGKFRWQDKAYNLACAIRERSFRQGFFGVNMASTGCGKTFANGKIMYGLADEKLGCRFSIALGLRTLTLQTGDALRTRLRLAEDDLAVLIGSQAVKDLHELSKNKDADIYENPYTMSGSESAEGFFPEHQYVRYEGALDDGRLSHWLKRSPKLHQLVSAPILVSTIDHLIPATEGERGGKQIAPMLRLLTADLVLDEPDDFDLSDLPAVARLVNWAGMLGARVLLSSATLPPVLVEALFDAYLAGRIIYQQAAGEPNCPVDICCGWFDEFGVRQSDHNNKENFAQAHNEFVEQRVKQLIKSKPLRKAKLLPIEARSNNPVDVIDAIARCFSAAISQLHQAHHQIHPKTGQRLSIGLIRMANIKPLVSVAEKLFSMEPPPDYRIHYCVYHSQHPLAVRSEMEKQLDAVLTRHNPEHIWQVGIIQQALADYPEENHIFVVLATPVAEVGRDHDYDWAIVEPSSMRSLIQLAGRIQRHRQQEPVSENLLVLAKNYKALIGGREGVAYTRPGFESGIFKLKSHDLNEILTSEQLKHINAIPRIQERRQPDHTKNLADLEHKHLRARLFGSEIPCYASHWWQRPVDWCGEMQRRTRFRKSDMDEQFFLYFEEDERAVFHLLDYEERLKPVQFLFRPYSLTRATRVHSWANEDYHKLIELNRFAVFAIS